jgi:creatinine amidohydrolase
MAALPKRRWQEMTTRDFADSDTSAWIAVLPVAAIEQHGPHLPVCTDTCIAEGMVKRSIELLPADLPVTFLPVQAVGKSNEHIAFPGTLTGGWETVTKLWLEIGESLVRAGLKKLIIVNSHGGNVPMVDIVTRELRVQHRMLAVSAAWSRFGEPEGLLAPGEEVYGIHGGDMETSVMLHFRPDLVRMDQAADFRSSQHDYIERFTRLRAHGLSPFGWQSGDLNQAGVVGNAAAATGDKGKTIVDHQVNGFVELCADVHAFDRSVFDA